MTLTLQDANDLLRARLARMLALTSVIERDLQTAELSRYVAAQHHDALLREADIVAHAVRVWRNVGGQA